MGVDVGSVAGIGFEASELFNMDKNNAYSIDYFNLVEEDELTEEFFEDIENKMDYIYYRDSFDMSGEGNYYLLAKDPITGVQDFINDLGKLGFNVTLDDLSFIDDVYFW